MYTVSIIQGSQSKFINIRESDELHFCEATNIGHFDRREFYSF